MPPKRLLVVDDSGFARRTLRKILEDGGFEVEEAGGGQEAIEKYASSKPDAVLLDNVMREMTGLEVLEQLRRVDPTALVIMATADVQDTTRNEAVAGGASGFINKPFKSEDVISTVTRVVNCSR